MPARRPLIAIAALFALLPAQAAAERPAFPLGVAAGEITATQARLWTQAAGAGPVKVELSRDASFRRGVRAVTVTPDAAHDRTVGIDVAGLRPGTRYAYRFVSAQGSSRTGRFRTAPRRSARAVVRFAVTGDADAQPAPGTTAPFYNDFGVYERMTRERNDFNINLGDTIYSDSEVPGAEAPALSVAAKWAKYRQNLAMPALRSLRAGAGLYSHWDDHEFINDFSVAEHGRDLHAAGVQAFLDYSPAAWSASRGLYRHVRWGANLELFFLDQRSFRDAKASAGGTCDNPATGAPDLAPSAPQPVRDAFGVLLAPLRQPVAAACTARIADPGRTFLGAAQLARFKRDVARSTATWKVVVNETPIQQFYALPYDRWEGYAAERDALLRYLRKEARNVVFVTTDTHATFVGPVRLRTLEAGGPKATGMTEFVSGPAATMSFRREIDAVAGQGTGAILESVFFKPAPPSGIGMSCAQTDAYSYLQVTARRDRLTVAPRGIDGRAIADGEGRCGPYRLKAK